MIDGLYKVMDIMHQGIEPGNSTIINDINAVVMQVKSGYFINLIRQQYSPATFDPF